ncbi:hypothetical protein PanWU01x14_223450, partial [Parasponia andersonii]
MKDFSEATNGDGELDGQLVVRPVSCSDNSISEAVYDQNLETEDELDPDKCLEGVSLLLADIETGLSFGRLSNGNKERDLVVSPRK